MVPADLLAEFSGFGAGSGNVGLGRRELCLGVGAQLGSFEGGVRRIRLRRGPNRIGSRLRGRDRAECDLVGDEERVLAIVVDLLLGVGDQLGGLLLGPSQHRDRLRLRDGDVGVDARHLFGAVGWDALSPRRRLSLGLGNDAAGLLLCFLLDAGGSLASPTKDAVLARQDRCHRRFIGEQVLGRGHGG